MPRVADDILPILTKFHREVVLPDIQRIVGDAVGGSERRLRDEIHNAVDALAQRLDRLETTYQMLVAGLKRVEERLDGVETRLDRVEAKLGKVEGRLGAIEQRLDRVVLKAEVQDLKARVDALERKIAEIDADL